MPLPELLRALWLWRWRILATWFLLLAAGIALVLSWQRQYVAEAVVIGADLLRGGSVSLAGRAAAFLPNVPEGLLSAAGMRRASRGATAWSPAWR